MWGSLSFQNAVSPVMEQLIFFHDHTMVVMVVVMVVVSYMLLSSMMLWEFHRGISEGQGLESIWTVLPGIFLLVIAFPSLSLLYLMEELDDPDLTVSAVGRQWYWSYEYADVSGSEYDSYMIPEGDSSFVRLMEVDNSLVLPVGVGVRIVITAGDVIHSWTVPALGVSADGIPGRLNQVLLMLTRSGLYVGQCSEICGANHSFMPIVVEGISKVEFLKSVL